MSDSSSVPDVVFGYAIAQKYLNQKVKVYLYNGSILVGTLSCAEGKFILVDSGGPQNDAIINLDHVASIIRR